MQYIPIQSYHKATLVALYDNEGEAKWDKDKLKREINNRPELINQLKEVGYKESSHSFTAQQISIIFCNLGHPILNEKNRELLKINNMTLLAHFEKNPKLISSDLEEIKKLNEAILSDLGLIRNDSPDCNPHYLFTGNSRIFFTRTNEGFFNLHDKNTLRVGKTIDNTKCLILTLLELKNKL